MMIKTQMKVHVVLVQEVIHHQQLRQTKKKTGSFRERYSLKNGDVSILQLQGIVDDFDYYLDGILL